MKFKYILSFVMIITLFLVIHKAFAGATIQSSAGSIRAFAENWWWSKQYNQDGKYGETKVNFSTASSNIISATLTVQGSYSQQAGSANAQVYISGSQQVTPKDAAHNKDTYWYGNTANLGSELGSFTLTYSGGIKEFDVTSYLNSNPSTVYYIAIQNLSAADIGISKIQISATEGEQVVLKTDGDVCMANSECQDSYCVHNICRSSANYCGDSYCDDGESCTNCSSDCGSCQLKREGESCADNSECEGGYCVHDICRFTSPYCGDNYCDEGECCGSCPADCKCGPNQCCSPSNPKAIKSCVDSGQTTTNGRICCQGKDYQGNCCGDADCRGNNQACQNHSCVSNPQLQSNQSGKTCNKPGQKINGGICCNGKIRIGACCTDAQCKGLPGTKCVNYRCTKFLDLFYKYYYRDKVSYNEGFVKPSDAYKGLAGFYREQAEQIDIPIMALGKFTKVLDALSDTGRSLISIDFLGLATNSYKLMQELDAWKLPKPTPLQNNLLFAYSAGSLVLEGAQKFDKIEKAVQKLSSKLPSNKMLNQISAQHKALQQKVLTEKEMGTLFWIEAADFIMDATLLEAVSNQLDYDVLDYTAKIQLSVIANEVALLYEKAQKHSLTEKESLTLMALEKEFWVGVIARSTNRITYLESNDYDAADVEEIKSVAEGWLAGIDSRRQMTTRMYFGK